MSALEESEAYLFLLDGTPLKLDSRVLIWAEGVSGS